MVLSGWLLGCKWGPRGPSITHPLLEAVQSFAELAEQS